MELKDPECTIAVLPGVPAEMKRMFLEQLVDKLPTSTVFVQRSTIRTFGYGESDAERLLGDLTARGRNPEVGITASQAVITLSITARAGSYEECETLAAAVREDIRVRLGDAVFGDGDIELHEAVGDQLLRLGLRIALLESSTTGGLIGQWLTETENHAKQVAYSRLFPTAMSVVGDTDSSADKWESILRAEAMRLLTTGNVDYVVISSPSQFDEEPGIRKLLGAVTVIGTACDVSQDVSMTGNLAIFRNRAARSALNLLRLHLKSL